MSDLVKALRDFSQMMPEGGASDPMIEVFASLAESAADEIERLDKRADRFRDLLFTRPAINADLPQSYMAWSGRMYCVDRDGFLREPEELLTVLATSKDTP